MSISGGMRLIASSCLASFSFTLIYGARRAATLFQRRKRRDARGRRRSTAELPVHGTFQFSLARAVRGFCHRHHCQNCDGFFVFFRLQQTQPQSKWMPKSNGSQATAWRRQRTMSFESTQVPIGIGGLGPRINRAVRGFGSCIVLAQLCILVEQRAKVFAGRMLLVISDDPRQAGQIGPQQVDQRGRGRLPGQRSDQARLVRTSRVKRGPPKLSGPGKIARHRGLLARGEEDRSIEGPHHQRLIDTAAFCGAAGPSRNDNSAR